MSTINYPSASPYSTTPQTSWYLSNWNYKPIPPDAEDTLYTLLPRHDHRPDILSYDLYGTPIYYWVFCIRNPFLRKDPLWDFVTGITIIVPSANYLKKVVG